MSSNIQQSEVNVSFTLGKCLTALYMLSKKYHRSMPVFFRTIFGSYHCLMGDLMHEDRWLTNQSAVSHIMSDQNGLPWEMRKYYILCDGDAHLRLDVQQYVRSVVQTAYQRNTHLAVLDTMIEQSTNLEDEDKAYILSYREVDSSNQLAECIFRALRTLIRYA